MKPVVGPESAQAVQATFAAHDSEGKGLINRELLSRVLGRLLQSYDQGALQRLVDAACPGDAEEVPYASFLCYLFGGDGRSPENLPVLPAGQQGPSPGADDAVVKVLDGAAVVKIHSAIRWNKPRGDIEEVVKSIGATMADAAAAADQKTGNQGLHIAAQNGHMDLIRFLLAAGAGVNGQNKKGQTPMHMAVEYDFYFATKLLLDAGADPRKTNADGHEALLGIDGGKTGLDAWDNPVNILKAAGDDKEQLDFALAELEKAPSANIDKITLAQTGMAKRRHSAEGNWDKARFMAIMKAL